MGRRIRTLALALLMTGAQFTPFAPLTIPAARAEEMAVTLADFGDAPDSTTSSAAAMMAYPGVTANFPTDAPLLSPVPFVPGPFHKNARVRYSLGRALTVEEGANVGLDKDGSNNIVPASDLADQDARDDGFVAPAALQHCVETQLQVAVSAFDLGQSFPEKAIVNVWVDYDRSGVWGEEKVCPGGPAREWAVQNHSISLPGPGVHLITLPAMRVWNAPAGGNMWLRITLSESAATHADGRGPAGGYQYGETEDYRMENVLSPLPPATIPPHQIRDLVADVPPPVIRLPLVSLPPGHGHPDDFKVPDGDLREMDMAHIGGSTNGPTLPLVVTVAGTGSVGRFSSWTMSSPMASPTFLQDGPQKIGYNHRLHVLTPPTSPKLAHEILVSGLIRDDTLWLTTWRILNNGAFVELDTQGYGPNASVAVEGYTMAHRPLAISANEKRFQLVTPILHGDGLLRIVTWEVNALTGGINGRGDSGDVDTSAMENSDISAIFAKGEGLVVPHYTVSLRNDDGNLVNQIWDVSLAGVPTLRGNSASGRDIQDSSNIVQVAQNVAIAPLADTGFVSAVNLTNGSLKMMTWENLVASCSGSCQYVPSNISDNGQDLNPNGSGIQQPLPAITTNRFVLRDPLYEDDLYTQNENTVQAIASVRKVMVTIVTLEAVADGLVSLDDEVTVSAAAAAVNNTGASVMGLVEGEVITLRDLLYGNMMVSAGDATWAISEHVGGSVDGMVDIMNDKAADLGMTNTTHCQEGTTFSAVSYSTARDQAILWESVYDDDLFLEFAGQDSMDVCGTLPGDVEICHPAIPPMTKGMTGYPNLDGHKTGGGGGLCSALNQFGGVPTCPSGGCLAIQATRLGRPLIATELQPSNLTANRWPDAVALYDYGYRQIFTPDFRATSGNQGGTAGDMAVDYVTDTHALSAALTGDKTLTLCSWSTQTGSGTITRTGCTGRDYLGMAPGTSQPPATRLDMVRISTLEAEGDYLVGRLEGNNLVMRLWRVGEKDF